MTSNSGTRPVQPEAHRPPADARPAPGRHRLKSVRYLMVGSAIVFASVLIAMLAGSVEAAPISPSDPGNSQPALWLAALAAAIILVGLTGLAGMVVGKRDTDSAGMVSGSSRVDRNLGRPVASTSSWRPGHIPAAMVDGETFDGSLRDHWNRCQRQSSYIAITMLVIDDFSAMADAIGHSKLEKRIASAGNCLTSLVESHGGLMTRTDAQSDDKQTFQAVFPDTTPDQALTIAEDMRTAIEDLGFDAPTSDRAVMTATVGVCVTAPAPDQPARTGLAAAWRALATARRKGPNRIEARMLDSGSNRRGQSRP